MVQRPGLDEEMSLVGPGFDDEPWSLSVIGEGLSGDDERTLGWDPPPQLPDDLHYLHVMDEEESEGLSAPEWVHELPLIRLSCPSAWVEQLRVGSPLVDSLRTLELSGGQRGGRADEPLTLPALTSLDVLEGQPRAGSLLLPELTFLQAHRSPAAALRLCPKPERVTMLELHGLRASDGLSLPPALRYLSLMDSRLSRLPSPAVHPPIQDLFLRQLQVSTLDGGPSLTHLERIWIQDCPRLRSLAFLNALPRLRHVWLIDMPDTAALAAQITRDDVIIETLEL